MAMVALRNFFNIVDDKTMESGEVSKKTFRINTFFPIIDRLVAELNLRLEAYQGLSGKFGFLYNFHLCHQMNLLVQLNI